MNTVTAKHMKELDRKTIEEYKIPSIVLMENAGIRTADIIHSQFGQLINPFSLYAGGAIMAVMVSLSLAIWQIKGMLSTLLCWLISMTLKEIP